FGYAGFGVILCLPFQRYGDGYRFAKLARDLVEKYGYTACKAKVYLSMEMVVLWTQPIDVGIDLIRTAFRAGAESGDLSFPVTAACISSRTFLPRACPSTTSGENLRSAWTSSVKENTGTPPKLSSASNNSSAISGARLRTFLPSATPTLTNGALKLS